jgi:hypothetical protein
VIVVASFGSLRSDRELGISRAMLLLEARAVSRVFSASEDNQVWWRLVARGLIEEMEAQSARSNALRLHLEAPSLSPLLHVVNSDR